MSKSLLKSNQFWDFEKAEVLELSAFYFGITRKKVELRKEWL